MISLANVWTMAAAELRLTRRLARYWVYLALSYLAAIGFYLQYSTIHAFGSSYSGTIALLGPHYMFGVIGLYYLAAFTTGVVFLAYDLRARDQREKIYEVLDSRPLSNLELVLGRFLGLFLAAWIPILALSLLLGGVGFILDATNAPFGDALEPWSLVTFSVFLSIPALAFAFALVFFITLVVRSRLLAAIVSLAVFSGMVAALLFSTHQAVPLLDFLGMTQMYFPSDILPGVANGSIAWLQRLGILVIAGGLLILTAAIHPRLDEGNRWKHAGSGALVLMVGLALTASAMLNRAGVADQLAAWRSAHLARVDEPRADITAMKGTVQIFPGKSLSAVVEMHFTAPAGEPLQRALFTLNPGLTVKEIKTPHGQTLSAEHEDGLLNVTLPAPLTPGTAMTIVLSFEGRPDTAFGYLDSALDVETASVMDGSVAILGYQRALFDAAFVALMPGTHWLPAAGVDVARDDTRTRPRDYFELDLTVELPTGWLAAGPDQRQAIPLEKTNQRARFRFAPQIAIPEVALVAAQFTSFSTEVAGIKLEALVHPQHTDNFVLLGAIKSEIIAAVEDRLTLAAQSGMPYPFTALTLVEVPASLRLFEGGWRMNSVAPPSLALMRETGLPTARFDTAWELPPIGRIDDETRRAQAQRERLEEFFANDFGGGNVFINTARSFYAHQTSATGPEALALNFALDELTTLVLSGRRGYFSAHLFDSGLNQRAARVMQAYNSRRPRTLTIADVVIQSFASRREVWDQVLDTSLVDLDPAQNPQQTIDALTLKAGAIAQAIHDQLGRERSARLLGSLIDRHRGSSFTVADFKAALREHAGDDFMVAFDDLLYGTRLPGFVAEAVDFYRLDDAANGDARYQLLVRVRNDEPAAGSIRIAWLETIDRSSNSIAFENLRQVSSDIIRLPGQSAIEFGVILPHPPVSIYVEPSLSLNRTIFLAEFLRPKQYEKPREPPAGREGVSVVPWRADIASYIAVDDLDARFTIRQANVEDGVRLGRAAQSDRSENNVDVGLPIATTPRPTAWSRREEVTSWGRYRHTIAYRQPGDGNTHAAFTTTLPDAGKWQLEMHLPNLPFIAGVATWGTWELTIEATGVNETFTFATGSGTIGWNLVRELELPAGEVTVLLSDKSDGRLVVADAVRFARAGRPVAQTTAVR